MKKVFATLLGCLLLGCAQKEVQRDYTIISGKLKNSDIASVRLISIDGDFNKEIPVDQDGVFLDTLKLLSNMPHRLADGHNNILLYLEKGYETHLDYDLKDFRNSIQFSGHGAQINRFYLLKENKYMELAGNDFEHFYAMEEAPFVKKVKEMNHAAREVLESLDSIPDHVREKENRAIDHYSTVLMGEFKDFAHASVTENPEFTVSANFVDKRDDMSFLNEEDFGYSVMYNALVHRHYREQIERRAKQDSLEANEAFFQVVEEIPVEAIRNAVLYRTVWASMPYIDDPDGYYKRFVALSTSELHKEKIGEIYQKIIKIVPGSPSPEFVDYENHAGGLSSLSDFKGKYVYIDVWASWCAPCIQEIPALKEIEKTYEGKNISFVSISIDSPRSYEAWKNIVVDKALGGSQLLADNAWESDFVQDYQIKGIPRFILIDPEGNIVDANAPSPSDETLETTFGNLGI
nr:TlpA disulfide reductase family protein [Allomuricauda sp.]